jgi:hypothetical protein
MLLIPANYFFIMYVLKLYFGGKFRIGGKSVKYWLPAAIALWILNCADTLVKWRYIGQTPWLDFSLWVLLIGTPFWSIGCFFYFRAKKRNGTIRFREDTDSSSS